MVHENPLLSPSTLPYRLPDYARIRPEHYLPAFEWAFTEHLREIEQIATSAAPPTFENTVVALEESGRMLEDVAHAFYTVASADATAPIQQVDEQLAPLMAAHEDAVRLDARLYARVRAVHDQLDTLTLSQEDRYLVERHHREMAHAGAALDAGDKARLSELNRRLSVLTTTFEKNLLADTNELSVVFEDAADLDGLSGVNSPLRPKPPEDAA